MALKEYIGLSRLTQAFSLLKSKIDTKEDTPTVISYDDFIELTPEQQTSGYYLVVGGTPITDAYGISYQPNKTVGDALDDHADAIDELNADKANKDLSNVTGTLPVTNGGTGATTAANARTNLGLGGAATQAVANNLTTTASGSVLDARQGKALNDKITNNATAGTTVALSNNSNYRAPNDGYVHITTNAGYPAFIYLRNNSYQNIAVQSCYNQSSGMQASIFVRKGIIVYPTFTTNQGSANFTPVTVS